MDEPEKLQRLEELSIKSALADLQKFMAFLVMLLDNLPDTAASLVSRDEIFEVAGGRFLRKVGYPNGILWGSRLVDVVPTPERLARTRALHRRVFDGEFIRGDYEFGDAPGEVVGEMHGIPLHLDLEDSTAITHVLIFVHDVTKQRAETRAAHVAEELAQHRADYDELTGLPRRGAFMTAMAAERGPFGVLFIDLDGFKKANDTLGHAAGNDILVDAGKRLLSCVRTVDVVARIGGDEFAILLSGLRSGEMLADVARRMVALLTRSYMGVQLGASVGGALSPEDGDEPLVKADQAMYRAKRSGGGFCRFT